MLDRTFEIVKGELFLLGGVEHVDERLSWYLPDDIGKFVAYNSYLLRSGNDCVLVESGAAAHHPTIREQLRGLLGQGDKLRIAVTRNEPECVCNIPNLVEDFGVTVLHAQPLMSSLQFFPIDSAEARASSFDARSMELQMLEFGVKCDPAEEGTRVVIDGEARLEPFITPLRVLPTLWFHDPRTRTLFCSDVFCAGLTETRTVRTNSEIIPEDEMLALMLRELRIKFEWLSRGNLGGIIETLEKYFAEHRIEILAPTRGHVIVGAEAVAVRLRALIRAMKILGLPHRPAAAGAADTAVLAVSK